ncbi:discoidin domain-containing protein [Kitasatospora sp. NBC_00374]|uniref:discoidin domain-containing protein n=1 Tax=Kitasatospora sp. NBC_00374 TaxID=2975964 RepID=UPI00324A9240
MFGGTGTGTASPSPSPSSSPPTTPPACNPGSGNLAQGKPATASGVSQVYGPANLVDGDANSYWESANNAFPQWAQIDLGCPTAIKRLVLRLPPSSAWAARSETVAVQRSDDGATFSTVVGATSYAFDPASGNTVTVNLPATTARHLRLTFTANSGWPAGQLSELQVFAS